MRSQLYSVQAPPAGNYLHQTGPPYPTQTNPPGGQFVNQGMLPPQYMPPGGIRALQPTHRVGTVQYQDFVPDLINGQWEMFE